MGNFVFYILCALVMVVPLIFSPRSLELFEFPKLLIIYFGASLLAPLLIFKQQKLVKLIFNRKSGNSNLIWAAILLFLLSQALSTLFSIDQHVSFFGYYSRFNGGLLSLLSYLIIMLSAWFFLNSQRVTQLLKIILGTGLIVALWGLPSHFGYDFICLIVMGRLGTACWSSDFIPELRMFSTLGQPNWFATYLLVLIFIVLYFFITGQSQLDKKVKQYSPFVYSLMFLLFSVELVWTNSKSGILTYIILVPLYLIANFFNKKEKLKSWLRQSYFLPLAIIVLVLFSALWPVAKQLTQSLVPSPNAKPTQNLTQPLPNTQAINITPSSKIRMIVWEGALKLGQKYPWFGTGVETFAYAYNFTRPMAHNLTSEWNFVYNKAHNELLNYLATSGYFGLVSYLLMFLVFVVLGIQAWKDPLLKNFGLFYLASLLAIFMMNFFGFSTTATNLLFYLLPALLLVYQREKTNLNQSVSLNTQRSLTRELSFGQLALYFVWLLFSFVYLLNYFSADYNYARAKEYKQTQDFTNAYIYGQKALDLRKEPVYLDQQAGVAANLAALQQIQKNNPQAQEFSRLAVEYNNLSLAMSPKNVLYYKTRAKVFYVLSMSYIDKPELSNNYFNKALQALEKARALAPTDPIIPYTQAGLFMQTEPEKASDLLRKTIDLKPDYQEARELLKQLQIN